MSKKVLTKEKQGILQSWVDENKSALGLTHWDIKVSPKSCSRNDEAETGTVHNSSDSRIRFSRHFLKQRPKRQRQTLVHELLHVVARDMHHFVMDALDHDQAHLYSTFMERTVDSLAKSIAPNFPEPAL